jgi:hypothetical protein
MGKQWETNGINMEILSDLENMETMRKQWENNSTKHDTYMDTFLQSDNYKNNGENNGTY